jgi:restriction endonuclease S subunit
MKDSSVPWLGMIPARWNIRSIKHFYRRKVEKNLPDGEVLSLYRDFGIVVKSSREDNFNKTSEDTSNYNVVDVYDLVVNKMKAWQGSVAVSEYRGIVSPAYYVCSPLTDTIYWRYIHVLLRAAVYHPEYRRLSEGIRLGQWDLSYDDWKNIRIPIPPIDEQRAIAEYLDKTTVKIDGLIAAQEHLIELLAEKRKALISHVVTKGLNPKAKLKDSGISWLGMIPAHWEAKRLKYTIKGRLKYGANESAEIDDPGLPRYVRITDIDDKGKLRQETFRSLPIEIAKDYFLEDGDVLFARSGATSGKTFLYRLEWGTCAYAGYLIRARLDKTRIDPQFLRHFTDSAPYWQWLESSLIQATIQNVSAEKYADLVLPMPPIEEQRTIAEYLDEATAKLDTLAAKAEEAIALMKERRSALISAVVTGKVKVS